MAKNRLPQACCAQGVIRRTITAFPGFAKNRTLGTDGIDDMQNMSCVAYPALSTRAPRIGSDETEQPQSAKFRAVAEFENRVYTVEGDGIYYRSGPLTPQSRKVKRCSVSFDSAERSTAALSGALLIMPDGIVIPRQGAVKKLNYSFSVMMTKLVSDETGDALYLAGADAAAIRQGDRVTIYAYDNSGEQPTYGEKLCTVTVRGIEKKSASEYILRTDRQSASEKITGEEIELYFVHTARPYAFMTVCDNRIWSCSPYGQINASCLGDPFNYDRFDGLLSDAWTFDFGREMRFCAAYTFGDRPVFFTEHSITQVYGSDPSEYSVQTKECNGVLSGCEKSIAQAGDCLYWLSPRGVVRYNGASVQLISQSLGQMQLRDGVAASDGRFYYLSCKADGAKRLLVYDTLLGTWTAQDDIALFGYTQNAESGGVVFFTEKGNLLFVSSGKGGSLTAQQGESFSWYAEFCDLCGRETETLYTANESHLHAFAVRMELAQNTAVKLYVGCDGAAPYLAAGCTAQGKNKGKALFYIPLSPHRADRYSLRIEGQGAAVLHSITRIYHAGSAIHTGAAVKIKQ